MLSEELFSSIELTHFPLLGLLQGVAKQSARNSEAKWILVSCEFPHPQTSPNYGGWRSTTACSPASLLRVHTNPPSLSPGTSPPAVPGKAVTAHTVSPRWSSPAQLCQPWGHAPPCSTKQLQCRRGSGSAINGRSTHWTPSQSTRHRQTTLCLLAHKRAFIWSSTGCLSCRCPPLSFPSPQAGEKTREQKPRTPEFQFDCWYWLIVWPYLVI